MTTLGEVLGEILEQMHDPSAVHRLLAETGDTALMSRLDQAVAETEQDLCEVVLHAVQGFSENADSEAWTKLIGRVQNSASPAGACLGEMIAWSLKR